MARIARVVAPNIPYHITQGGTGGTVEEMSMVSQEFMAFALRQGVGRGHKQEG